MAKPFKGVVNVDVTDSVPDWGPYTQPIAPEGTPSVLYVVLDDVGYSAMECFGGLIDTPNINRIADRGLLYTNFHTTALCSPTRSCLMTGRNHTTNGMATITEAASGFPSSKGHGEGLNIGKDGAEPVTDDYPGDSPWLFVGGAIVRAAVDVSGEPFVDLANEARMAFARD
jgi:hypothetical protein